MWDIGTVFSVATLGDVSDVFVFKGSVQVTDEAGDGIALCEVGEGARARAGVPAVKVAADWPQARTLFLPVRGQAAVAEPQKALDAARQIGELWMAKYMTEEASRIREEADQEAALRNAPKKVPFTKTAWVRPFAPAQQEERSMSAPSKACDMQSVKIRYRESQASTLLPNVQTGRQQTVWSHRKGVARP